MPGMSDDDAISYLAVPSGVPVVTATGHEIGTLEHVLQIPEEDLFDGLVVTTRDGLRFVDADQVQVITRTYVRSTLDDDAAAPLPAPPPGPRGRPGVAGSAACSAGLAGSATPTAPDQPVSGPPAPDVP